MKLFQLGYPHFGKKEDETTNCIARLPDVTLGGYVSTFAADDSSAIQALHTSEVCSLDIFKNHHENSCCLHGHRHPQTFAFWKKWFLPTQSNQENHLQLSSADPKALNLKWQKQLLLTWRTRDKKNSKRQLSSSSHFPMLLKHLSDFKYPVSWVQQAGKSPFSPNSCKAIYSNISKEGNVHETVKSGLCRDCRSPSDSF